MKTKPNERNDAPQSAELLAVGGYLLFYFVLSRALTLLYGYVQAAAQRGELSETLPLFVRQTLFPLAYLLPLAVALFARRERVCLFALPTRSSFSDTLPLLPLFFGSVITCAYLTCWVMTALGLPITGGGVAGAGFFSDLFRNCLVPALFEELFFRGLILSLLYQKMGRGAIWVSAVIFALAHGSLYQLPYAFVGGLFLSLAAVVGGSVWVPFVFHFANNLLSLILQYTPQAWNGVVLPLVYGGIGMAALAAFLYLGKRRDTPAGAGVRALFASPRECGRVVLHATFASPIAFFLIPMLILTIVRVLV